MKILVAADGSPYTKRMIAYLSAHDEWLGAHHAYTVVTVTPGVPMRAAAALDKVLLDKYYEDEAARVVKPIRAFFAKRGMQADFVAKIGHAADHIATLATKGKFDLLVMGSHGHGALGNLVMGSVVTKVLALCETPVLLVR